MSGILYRAGIDIGSTTAKMVVVDEHNQLLYSAYRRHHAQAAATLQTILQEAREAVGEKPIGFLLTGSAGLGLTEAFALPFIQEVVASAEVIRQQYPAVRTLIDVGGEDAKIIFFDENARPDMRMNGSCAGGTGAFIDELATLLNVPVTELDALAAAHTNIYPIASRCGVFAKTDVQNLLSRHVPKEDIAASVLHAVVLQILATLSRGRDIQPALLFSGGPFTFVTELKRAFLRVLDLDEQAVIHAQSPELISALGAALAVDRDRRVETVTSLIRTLTNKRRGLTTASKRHAPLFASDTEFHSWEQRQEQHRIARTAESAPSTGPLFLGIDSGSTTTKVVVIDDQGRVVASDYRHNRGNAVHAVGEALTAVGETLTDAAASRIAFSAATGYGEDLIRTAFGLEQGIVETMAHFRAARAFDPQVTFILDIGGQDMKAIFVENGQIRNIEINEACSSGCGSFIESFARNMGYSAADFAALACTATAPYDLGTRCTVFMNSRVKQALREGAAVADIAAGLAFSVIKNALYKVLKITDIGMLGEHIVVQGGTFRNPAVQRALELQLGRAVVRPDLAELMGAYGAALCARDSFRTQIAAGTTPARTFAGFAALDNTTTESPGYRRREIECHGCANRCTVTKLTFPNGNSYYSGNRCEKVFSNGERVAQSGISVPDLKYQLLFDRPVAVRSGSGATKPLRIGIPRVLNMYENYPFWHALLSHAGVEVVLSGHSSNDQYRYGAPFVMSENLCFPGKLVSGHILELARAKVDRIFYPMVFFERKEFSDADNCFNCPVVSGYPEVIRAAVDPARRFEIPFDTPSITFDDNKLLERAVIQYLGTLGVPKRRAKSSFQTALAAQEAFKARLVEIGAQRIAEAETAGRRIALLLGRPYHVDPLIHHRVPEILTDLGLDVLTEDSIPMDGTAVATRHVVTQWEYINRYFRAAHWAGGRPNVVVVQLNSFGCGPDPFVLDEVRAILAEYGKRPTVIRIDEIESTGSTKLRLRSMIESLDQSTGNTLFAPVARTTTKPFTTADRERILIVPDFAPFCSPAIVRPIIEEGYRVVALPPADQRSVEAGLKYTNNEICYPGIITLGDIVKALQSGQFDPSRVAVGFSQTGGQCRATNYPAMIKKALVAAGFAEVPVVTISTNLTALNDQPGFRIRPLDFAYKAAIGMMYSDAISSMFYATVPRETNRGSAQTVADRYMQAFITREVPLNAAGLIEWLERAVADFNAIAVHERPLPQVGIVGEIYVKYNAFSNNHVVDWLHSHDIEVVMPSFFEFIHSAVPCTLHAVKSGIARRDAAWLFTMLAQPAINRLLRQFDTVMQRFRRYRAGHGIDNIAAHAQEILSLNHQYGEGWLIAGEIASLAREGVQNVLCLQPFGCIANHVVAKGVQKRLSELHKELNLLFLDADAGVSEANFFNRLHFFVTHAKAAAGGVSIPVAAAAMAAGR